ncbi:MAG: hypothetical protein ACQEXM_11460 [Actinomycetota bacterium]
MDEGLAVGAVLGDFEIRGRLGAGGWGSCCGPTTAATAARSR